MNAEAERDDADLRCPSCRDMAQVRKVSAIVREGTSTTTTAGGGIGQGGLGVGFGRGTTRSELTQRLAPPPEPSPRLLDDPFPYSFVFGVPFGMASLFCLVALGNADASTSADVQSVVFLIAIMTGGVAAACIYVGVHKMRMVSQLRAGMAARYPVDYAAWESHVAQWQRLHYCSRCDGVFGPRTAGLVPIEEFRFAGND